MAWTAHEGVEHQDGHHAVVEHVGLSHYDKYAADHGTQGEFGSQTKCLSRGGIVVDTADTPRSQDAPERVAGGKRERRVRYREFTAQQVVGGQTTVDQWQWVHDGNSDGFYFNDVTGEARWDDPGVFLAESSHALTERGHHEYSGQVTDESTLTAFNGEPNHKFIAEDDTVWRYDESLGDYVAQQEDKRGTGEWTGELFKLDPVAGLPWQRVESDQGPYYYNTLTQESSWYPPPEWGGRPPVESPEWPRMGYGYDEYSTKEGSYDTEYSVSYVDTLSKVEGNSDSPHNDGRSQEYSLAWSEAEDGVSAITTGGTTSSAGGPVRHPSIPGANGSGTRSEGACESVLDRSASDMTCDWSVEKLRDISKTSPGKWVVSDYLLDRAVEDYDNALEMNDEQIAAHKSKGTSRIIRSLIGPEEGEEDDEDDIELSDGSDMTDESQHCEEISVFGVTNTRPAAQPKAAESAHRGKGTAGLEMKRSTKERRGSLLGLESASGGTAEGLGSWKPGFAVDGSLYFVHQDTGQSIWTYPVRAWEVKARQLELLTPRRASDLGRGVCRLRETAEMRKKRLAYRWQVEQKQSKDRERRRENPTADEAAQDAIEKIVTEIERRRRREERALAHCIRAQERAQWHPSTLGFLMKRLESSFSEQMGATGNLNEGEQRKLKIISDGDFVDMKLTQAGEALQRSKDKTATPDIPPIKRKGRVSSLLAKLPKGLSAPRLPKLLSMKSPSAAARSFENVRSGLTTGFFKEAILRGKEEGLGKHEEQYTTDVSSMDGDGGSLLGAHPVKVEDITPKRAKRKRARTGAQGEQGEVNSKEEESNTPLEEVVSALGSDVEIETRGKSDDKNVFENVNCTDQRGEMDQDTDDKDSERDGNAGETPLGPGSAADAQVGEVTDVQSTKDSSSDAAAVLGQTTVTAPLQNQHFEQDKHGNFYQTPRIASLGNFANLDDKVRGLAAKLALRMEGHTLSPWRGGATSGGLRGTALTQASSPPLEPDVSRVILELACTLPPYNLLTTVMVEDPGTGKAFKREELTSSLRDAWERTLIRDVATAGGIDERQVLIEEIRRGQGSFVVVKVNQLPRSYEAILPFRPDRCDETNRFSQPPCMANQSGSNLAAIGTSSDTTLQQRAAIPRGDDSKTYGGYDDDVGSLADKLPLQPSSAAGIRATLRRRLRRPEIKRIRGRSTGLTGGEWRAEAVSRVGHEASEAIEGPEAVNGGIGGEDNSVLLFRGLPFVDQSAADTVALGIGAGNCLDWGIPGRTHGRKNVLNDLRRVDDVSFHPGEDTRKADPEIVAALQRVQIMDRGLKTWQAKDTVMRGLDPFQRVPTKHELKLAARVERARVLFGPGGYLPAWECSLGAAQHSMEAPVMQRDEQLATVSQPHPPLHMDAEMQKVNNGVYSKPSSTTISSAERTPEENSNTTQSSALADSVHTKTSSSHVAPTRRSESAVNSCREAGAKSSREVMTTAGNRSAIIDQQAALVVGSERLDLTTNRSMKEVGALRKMRTIVVTLTIVGGTHKGRGFTNMLQRGKTASEVVAQHIALQMRNLASDLLNGGLTHTAVSARWSPSSRGRVLESWEAYWCHSISPVFFGRSTRSRRVTKGDIRRKRELKAAAAANAATKRQPQTDPDRSDASMAEASDMTNDKSEPQQSTAVIAKSDTSRKESTMTLNEQLEEAEMVLQALLSDGLADGGHMNPQQYQALLVRDRAIKKVLVRRKLNAKRKGGGLVRKPFPYRRLPSREIRGWTAEFVAEDRVHRAVKRAEASKRQEERMVESRKRNTRFKLRTWLIRHLVTSNGDEDLMARAIALQDKEDASAFISPAARGAVGRESSLTGRNMRPGGKFTYDREASPDHLAKADLVIKARRRFEQNSEALLRETFFGVLTATRARSSYTRDSPAVGDSSEENMVINTPSSVSDPTPSGNLNTEATLSANDMTQSKAVESKAVEATSGTVAAHDGVVAVTSGSPKGVGELAGCPQSPTGVVTISRSETLRILRQQGTMRRKALASNVLRPILTDRNFTKAFLFHPGSVEGAITEDELALFGSVVAEVDRWYTRVRATLDPQRAIAEARVKEFGGRKATENVVAKSARREGPAPNDWKRSLNVSREAARGDGLEWSRFHHHVLIRTSPVLPLYCCICRHRKWDEHRGKRLRAEHAARQSWEAAITERQEILEPLVQGEVRAALRESYAVSTKDKTLWAVLRCMEQLHTAIPGRVPSLQAAADVIEALLDDVNKQSFSIEERTRKRRMAALRKLRALDAFHDGIHQSPAGTKGRRRSRRVSVGPSTIKVTVSKVSRSQAPLHGPSSSIVALPICTGSEMVENKVATQNGHFRGLSRTETGGAPSQLAGNTVVSSGGGRRKGYHEFNERTQGAARTYYDSPQGFLSARIHATMVWRRLREVWFQEEEYPGEGLDEEKGLLFEACVVEVLEGERAQWERQEVERRGLFREDEMQRRHDESLCRAAEAAPRECQEAGQRAFSATIDILERRAPDLTRLRWEFTAELGNLQSMTARVRDAATGKRYMCRFLPCRGEDEVAFLLQEAYRIQKYLNQLLARDGGGHGISGVGEHIRTESRRNGNVSLPTRKGKGLGVMCWAAAHAQRIEVWVRQVAHALSSLHADGGTHRNINADCVYLDENGRAKLGGYHWLEVPSNGSLSGKRGMDEGFGCLATVPPEYELHGETSPKGDVWSLGCALFKWTTGKEFAYVAGGLRLQEALNLVPPSYGEKIKTALSMCLQRDPAFRVSSMDLWKFMSTSSATDQTHSAGRGDGEARQFLSTELAQ